MKENPLQDLGRMTDLAMGFASALKPTKPTKKKRKKKMKKKQVALRLDPAILDLASSMAEELGVSLNQYVTEALHHAMIRDIVVMRVTRHKANLETNALLADLKKESRK